MVLRPCPGKKVNLPSASSGHLYEKKVDPFARANGSCACYIYCLALTELTWLGEPNCLWRKVDLARRETVPSRKGYLGSRVNLLAQPTFCGFSCKWFVNAYPIWFWRQDKSFPAFQNMKSWLAHGSLGRHAAYCSNIDNFPPNKPGLTRWRVTRIQNLGSCLMFCQFLAIMVS